MAIALETEKQSLWHHPNFLKLWASETISQFGTQFSGYAIPFTAILLTANQSLSVAAAEFGVLNAFGVLAFPLFALFIGVYVDRHRKRRIMVAANLGRGLSLGLIPLAAVTGTLYTLGLPLLYVVGFFIGLLTVFFDVSYQAILPFLVDRKQLVEGNSKLEASRSSAQLVGPGMAGALLQLVTIARAPFVIAIDALSYLGSASFLARLRNEAPIKQPTTSVWHDLREGLAVVLKDTRLRSIAGSTATSNFFSSSLFAILLLYLYRELGFAPVLIGLIFTVGSTGALVGVVVSSKLASRVGVGPVIIGSALTSGLGTAAYFIVNKSFAITVFRTGPLWLLGAVQLDMNSLILMVGSFVTALSVVVYNINQVSLRQAIVPLRLQGRMNASMRWIVWGTLPAGSLAGGILGAVLGLRPAIGLAVVGGSLAFLWVLLSPVRSLKRVPEPLE
jgi:MFS family permease